MCGAVIDLPVFKDVYALRGKMFTSTNAVSDILLISSSSIAIGYSHWVAGLGDWTNTDYVLKPVGRPLPGNLW